MGPEHRGFVFVLLEPVEERHLARDLGKIEDPELHQALEGLGRAVKGFTSRARARS